MYGSPELLDGRELPRGLRPGALTVPGVISPRRDTNIPSANQSGGLTAMMAEGWLGRPARVVLEPVDHLVHQHARNPGTSQ
jgi:hypothetical protein